MAAGEPFEPAPIAGLSHIQLVVDDVAASEQWWTTVLGLERLAAADDGTYVALRHRLAKLAIVLSLRPDMPAGAGPAAAPVERLDHVAFAVPDQATLETWAQHLTEAGIDHPGIILELGNPSLQLQDPNGISLELVSRPR